MSGLKVKIHPFLVSIVLLAEVLVWVILAGIIEIQQRAIIQGYLVDIFGHPTTAIEPRVPWEYFLLLVLISVIFLWLALDLLSQQRVKVKLISLLSVVVILALAISAAFGSRYGIVESVSVKPSLVLEWIWEGASSPLGAGLLAASFLGMVTCWRAVLKDRNRLSSEQTSGTGLPTP